MILALHAVLSFCFFSVLYFSVFVCLSVLLCSESYGLIQINVYMYVFYQLVSSVVTLNTSVTAKVKKCNKDYCIKTSQLFTHETKTKTHEHCIISVTTISCYTILIRSNPSLSLKACKKTSLFRLMQTHAF